MVCYGIQRLVTTMQWLIMIYKDDLQITMVGYDIQLLVKTMQYICLRWAFPLSRPLCPHLDLPCHWG